MQSITTISFVRHGHVHNPTNVIYGRLPGFPLSDKGLLQAEAVGQALRSTNLGAIYSSPMLRAQQTAKIISKFQLNKAVYVSSLLNEAYTPYQGLHISEIDGRELEKYNHSDPSYEQPSDILNRAIKFIEKVLKKHSKQHIVAVTHGDLINFLCIWANQRDINPVTASISTFKFEADSVREMIKFDYCIPY